MDPYVFLFPRVIATPDTENAQVLCTHVFSAPTLCVVHPPRHFRLFKAIVMQFTNVFEVFSAPGVIATLGSENA